MMDAVAVVLQSFFFLDQIEEGTVLYAAGGVIIEHPLVLPYIKEVVSVTLPPYALISANLNHSRDGVSICLFDPLSL